MIADDALNGLKLRLTGYTRPGQELYRNILLDTLVSSLAVRTDSLRITTGFPFYKAHSTC